LPTFPSSSAAVPATTAQPTVATTPLPINQDAAEKYVNKNYIIYTIIATVIASVASISCWCCRRRRNTTTSKKKKKGGIQVNQNIANNNKSTERVEYNKGTTKKRTLAGLSRKKEQTRQSVSRECKTIYVFRKATNYTDYSYSSLIWCQSRTNKTQLISDSSESDGDWNCDKYNDDDEESGNHSRSERPRRRKSESSDESKHKRRRRNKSPVEESSSSESSNESESSGESFFVERKRRRRQRRRKSRVEELSSSESSEESSVEEKITRQVTRSKIRRTGISHADSAKTTELRNGQRNIESWHEKEKERSKRILMGDDSEDDMKRSFEKVAEESVRKARSVMADYDEQMEGRVETQLGLVTDIG
jgi:hypothetical protein